MNNFKIFLESIIEDNSLKEIILEGYDTIFEVSSGTIFWGTSQRNYDASKKANGVLPTQIQMTTDLNLAKQYAQYQSSHDGTPSIVASYNIPQLYNSAHVLYEKPRIYSVDGTLTGEIGTPQVISHNAPSGQQPLSFSRNKKQPNKNPLSNRLTQTGSAYSQHPGGLGLAGSAMQMAGGAINMGKDVVNLFRRKK